MFTSITKKKTVLHNQTEKADIIFLTEATIIIWQQYKSKDTSREKEVTLNLPEITVNLVQSHPCILTANRYILNALCKLIYSSLIAHKWLAIYFNNILLLWGFKQESITLLCVCKNMNYPNISLSFSVKGVVLYLWWDVEFTK